MSCPRTQHSDAGETKLLGRIGTYIYFLDFFYWINISFSPAVFRRILGGPGT